MGQANVTNLDTLRRAKAAMIEFIEEGKLAIDEAVADVQKTIFWLDHDRLPYWQGQVKKCHTRVQQAKSELYRAQMASRDERPSCVVERKALARAEEALQHAESRVNNTRRWIRTLDREGLLFKSALASLGSALEVELPNAVAHLEQLMDHLAAYIRLQAPQSAPSEAPADAPEPGGTTGGGGR